MVMQKRRKKLGEILIAQGLVTEEQLLHALQEHRSTGASLGKILIRLGYLSEDDLSSVLGEQIQLAHKKRIGEVLIEQGLITQEQLEQGLAEQKVSKLQLGKCLIKLGFITEEKLVDVLSAQLDIQHVVLEHFSFNSNLLKIIPEEMARKYKVIPLFEQEGVITVAMADPSNLRTIDHLKFKTGKEVEPVIATEKEIVAAIQRNYHAALEEMTELLGSVDGAEELDLVQKEDDENLTDEEGAQVVKVVNLLINQAIIEGASDIHLEPMEKYMRLRYRVDGELIEKNPIPLQLRAQITSRIKIMSGMDIAEKRKPQDGRIQILHEGREIDLRVSTYPASTRKRGVNEKIVMRILDPKSLGITIDQIGFMPFVKKKFSEIIKKPDGILLVTGPTGSGKSSTLYASLQKIYNVTKNIITMEDPVELHFDGISQGNINPKAGFSFADGMRSILRQDPDIIMIGEMRDKETCEMAVQAALTGHFVLSSLHTNDSPSAYTRLLDMGLEPFLITSTVVGVLAQRLVRKLCPRCKKPYDPQPEMLKSLGLKPGMRFFQAPGCKFCKGSGYKGRMGVFELLIPDEVVTKMAMERAPADKIKRYLLGRGDFDSLRRDGIRKVLEGLTTIEQVLGATQNDE
ncbi:ATPase, T2SS/T4P/T4SS family [Chitinispirillales bacterium ANBcel5]|uniref:GspE/PulE family protein n=1 Tax=Cellulosispirillum alkaliphilum TaxID=3039283 RepID=UPI002A57DB33|nr:ATPase, T2SS/T4P/T4SS family [Chitinispirillales bacterium ANBcel5]